jgi:hypothetical protein
VTRHRPTRCARCLSTCGSQTRILSSCAHLRFLLSIPILTALCKPILVLSWMFSASFDYCLSSFVVVISPFSTPSSFRLVLQSAFCVAHHDIGPV